MDKTVLLRYARLTKEIDDLERAKQEYLRCLGKAGCGDGMPHGGGISDPTARAAFALAGYQDQIDAKLDEALRLQDEVERELAELDPLDSIIISLRYLCGLRWGNIAAALYRHDPDYAGREQVYARRVKDRAIKIFRRPQKRLDCHPLTVVNCICGEV